MQRRYASAATHCRPQTFACSVAHCSVRCSRLVALLCRCIGCPNLVATSTTRSTGRLERACTASHSVRCNCRDSGAVPNEQDDVVIAIARGSAAVQPLTMRSTFRCRSVALSGNGAVLEISNVFTFATSFAVDTDAVVRIAGGQINSRQAPPASHLRECVAHFDAASCAVRLATRPRCRSPAACPWRWR